MAINRDMKSCTLQEKKRTRTASGAWTEKWENLSDIQMAIYQTSESIYAAGERYKDSTHTGLTHCKDLKAGMFRIMDGDKVYQILSCDTRPRLTVLILKEVSTNV